MEMRCDFLEFPLFIFCILELFWAFFALFYSACNRHMWQYLRKGTTYVKTYLYSRGGYWSKHQNIVMQPFFFFFGE